MRFCLPDIGYLASLIRRLKKECLLLLDRVKDYIMHEENVLTLWSAAADGAGWRNRGLS
jgi:hypothetical protein